MRWLDTKFAFLTFLMLAAGIPSFGNAFAPPDRQRAPDFSALEALKAQEPALFDLYEAHKAYYPALSEYASRQGFKNPVENLATTVHEVIHLASVTHQGYFVDGTYYEPHVRLNAWPTLKNRDIVGFFESWERGIIFSNYLPSTPENSLGNIVDEINAYTHVLPFICRNEPGSSEKQIRNLIGHLNVQEVYLRVARLKLPEQYRQLAQNKESRGAIALIGQRAWRALQLCGVQNSVIPGRELAFFIEFSKPDTTPNFRHK